LGVKKEYTEIFLIRHFPDLMYGVGSRNWARETWTGKIEI